LNDIVADRAAFHGEGGLFVHVYTTAPVGCVTLDDAAAGHGEGC
jgi:hypothetical protein